MEPTATLAHAAESEPTRGASKWKETLAAVLVLLVELWVFFQTPLARYEDVHYSSADLTQGFSLTRIAPGHQPGNQLQSDAVTQMQPWLMFNRDELRTGRFPLWNPLNGAGCPHFANYQSAVLSPFSAPFYVLDFKTALLASAALKLFLLGFFTYLFLRRIGCGWIAGIIGASAFTFAGHNALLLYFPHVGAMVVLPAGLYFAEVALARAERALAEGREVHVVGPLIGLCFSFLAGLLAGNPEPFYFASIVVGLWALVRLIGLWRANTSSRAAHVTLAKLAAKLVFAVSLAVGLAAVQLLPFFEYLNASRVLEQRGFRQTPLEARWWPLMLFPNALGSPASPYKISDQVPPPNYELVNMAYVGGAAVFLALLCPLIARRHRGGLFFPIFGAVWILYAYDLFGVYDVIRVLPTLDLAPMNRSQGVWNFAVAAAAALAVDALIVRVDKRAWLTALWVVIAGGVALIACLIGADRLIGEFALFPSPNHALFQFYVPQHLALMSAWFGACVVLVMLTLLVSKGVLRRFLCLGLIATVFVPTGWLLRDYNPVCEDRFFFPRTPAIQALQKYVGDERLAILGEDAIPPASNIAYGLNVLSNYDGMWLRDFDFLYRDQFGDGNNWRPILKGTKHALRTFGVHWVLAKWGWSFLDHGMWEFPKSRDQVPLRQEILPDRNVVQTFKGREEGLNQVMVVLSTPFNVRDCTLHFRLEEIPSGRVLTEQTLTSHEVQADVFSEKQAEWPHDFPLNPHGRPVVFRFEREANSIGKEYKITLSCPEGRGGSTVVAWSMPLNGYGEGRAFYGKKPLAGELLFDWSYDAPGDWEETARIGDYVLYKLRDTLPTYSLVSSAAIADTDQEALGFLRAPTFDTHRLVILDGRSKSAAETTLGFASRDNSKRHIVQFSDSPFVYLVSLDGKQLVHIDDEATFLANKFDWKQIEKRPASERANFVLVPDSDRERKRAFGLRMVNPPTADDTIPTVLEETPARIQLKISRKQPGYLVATNAYFPGWKARLNGEEAPLYRANYAFQAVEIPPGSWNVELCYEPDSLRHGLWIGIASALVGAASLVHGLRRRPITS